MAGVLHIALLQLLATFILRAAPFAAHVVCSRASSGRARAVGAALFAGVVGLGFALDADVATPLAAVLVALVYFGLLALGTHRLSQVLDPAAYSRALLMVALAGTYVVLPAMFVPGSLSVSVQLIGWEMMLASYSYLVEVGSARQRRLTADTWRDCLFFLLVNPTLVYVERGERIGAPALRSDGLTRLALGLGAMFTHFAIFAGLLGLPALAVVPLDAVSGPASYLQFAGYYLVRFAAGYAIHSGLASIQIGLMRLIGYRVPERYHYPFLARDVPDFWRRWNTYVGSWARRYLFTPLVLKIGRQWPGLRRTPARGLAVLATFAAIGAAHDLTLITRHGLVLPATMVFVAQAVVFIASVAAGSSGAAMRLRSTLLGRVSPMTSRLVLWHVLMLSLWFAIPTMSSGGLDEPLSELKALAGLLE